MGAAGKLNATVPYRDLNIVHGTKMTLPII